MAKKSARLSSKTEAISVTPSCGNVFADMGLENAGVLQIKADLMLLIYDRLHTLKLTQSQAAKRLGIGQPDVSKLMNGRFTRFSVNRLLELISALGMDVDMIFRPSRVSSTRRGVMRVISGSKNVRA